MIDTNIILLPSPYLIAPAPVYCDSRIIVCSVLDELTSMETNQDLIQTVTGQMLIMYRKLVVGEFCRQTIDSRFPHWKPHKKLNPMIMLEVNLWKSIFTMLEYISNLRPLIPHSALFLRDLVEEGELMVFIATYSGGELRMKNYLARRQHENRKLQGCENPFNQEESPHTWKVINWAIKLADIDDEFRKKFYMPVVTARQKFTTFMKEDNYRLYFNGKLQRQGRKKETIASKA
ncbi:hypothetical protein [Anabaena sp. UHCC 0399]|uniref:hypothetical protein n=1 Tax=Anabaena sp. UHCC 0399 TaxID=3110238 RepID=UPI002B1FBDD7|nr:hypothetical protein [Anabaena sp. UHCC 0399]MEA5566304.1 hypothetical protein [Anabaena sp. UHCC 0399]